MMVIMVIMIRRRNPNAYRQTRKINVLLLKYIECGKYITYAIIKHLSGKA